MLLMWLGIAAVVVSSVQSWLSSSGSSKKKSERAFNLILASFTIAVLLINGAPWAAKLISHRKALNGIYKFESSPNLPNCSVWSITILPKDPIKTFHLALHFKLPIHQSVVLSALDVGENPNLFPATNTRIDSPCEVLAKSADRDENLTFGVSSDQHYVTISGHDLSSYDALTFVATFYPDYVKDEHAWDMKGDATYEDYGQQLSAIVNLNDFEHKADITLR